MSATEELKSTLMVGMEIHVELATKTKMWTGAPNVAHPDYYEAEPNSLVDPVVTGMPGTLPVMNKEALEMSIRVGLALGCKIAKFTKWDRKGYYYPDLPKGYQISQYDLPLCYDGAIDVPVSDAPDAEMRTVRIRRAHLEEDAGKLMHEAPGGHKIDHSIVDLNRAGTPLLEIVTEPDLISADHAVQFGNAVRDICLFLGVSGGIMQKGHMRFEPNINVVIEKDGEKYATPIIEIKNLNSFRALKGAIEFEEVDQVDRWLDNGVVMGERAKSTRGWDDVRGVTTHQRAKEDADEYRYFPDPDLVPVTVEDSYIEAMQATIPELPFAKKQRFIEELKINPKSVEAILADPKLCFLFEEMLGVMDSKRAVSLLLNVISKYANEKGVAPYELGISVDHMATIEKMLKDNKLNSSSMDKLYGELANTPNEDPEKLAEEKGLVQVTDDSALDEWVDAALADPNNAAAIEDMKNGKMKAIGRIMGSIMKASKGQANPGTVQAKIKEKLGL